MGCYGISDIHATASFNTPHNFCPKTLIPKTNNFIGFQYLPKSSSFRKLKLKQKNNQPNKFIRPHCCVHTNDELGHDNLRHLYKKAEHVFNLIPVTVGVGAFLYGIVMTIRDGNLETIPYSKRRHVVLLSVAKEKEAGEEVFKNKKKEFGKKILSPHHPYSVRVKSISTQIIKALERDLMIGKEQQQGKGYDEGDKLLMKEHLEGLNWEVLVVDKDVCTSFCIPGGKIVVYTGLLKHLKSDAEIATVIGHEVGHLVARHTAESYGNYLWISIINILLYCMAFVCLDEATGLPPIDSSALIIDITKHLLELPVSRRMELEADYIGMLLMASAGYDPRVAPKVYEMFDKFVCGDDYFSTHPRGKTRADSLALDKVMEEAMSIYQRAKQSIQS